MIRPGYFVRQALRGMRAKPMIQLAAVGAIAVGLLLVGVAVVCALNVERLANHWGRGTQLTVYLKQDATRARADALAKLLRSRHEVARVRYISPRDARKRLGESLGSRAAPTRRAPRHRRAARGRGASAPDARGRGRGRGARRSRRAWRGSRRPRRRGTPPDTRSPPAR